MESPSSNSGGGSMSLLPPPELVVKVIDRLETYDKMAAEVTDLEADLDLIIESVFRTLSGLPSSLFAECVVSLVIPTSATASAMSACTIYRS